MAAQLFVRDIEIPDKRKEKKLRVEVGSDSFLSLTFDEALNLFLERAILSPEDAFDELGKLRRGVFSARELTSLRMLSVARDALAKVQEEGGTRETFIAQIRDGERSLGVSAADSGYLGTVFETNLSSAYSAGRDVQLTQPAVIEAVPYRVYQAVLDARTRPSHAALDGKTWDARVTSEWRRFQGPNGYNCRCGVVSEIEASPAQLSRVVSHPEEAFDQPPTVGL